MNIRSLVPARVSAVALAAGHRVGRTFTFASKPFVMALATFGMFLLAVPQALFAQTQTIDFEQFTGTGLFDGTPASTVQVGIATFSGGRLLDATAGLPADQTTVYGTAAPPTFNCPGCSPTIFIDFSQRVSNVSLKVLNGQIFTVTYTVQDSVGGSQVFSLVANNQQGQTTVTLPSVGITQVTVTSDRTATNDWDFFIDDVQFTLDSDGDGIPDATDNAPFVYNPNQEDTDADGAGDVADNCPAISNSDQADGDGDLLGTACDDKTHTASLPGGNTAAPGAPLLVTFNIAVSGTFSGFLIKPTCVNIFQNVTSGENQVPPQERYNPIIIPDDLVPVSPGQNFSVTCNVLDAVSPGSLVPGTYSVTGFYGSDYVDPDIIGGVCTVQPCFTNIFRGVIKSNSVDFTVTTTTPATGIRIDIKFGTFPNSLNPEKKGTIPVTIFGSPSFNVNQINPASLRLAGSPLSEKNKGGLDFSFVDQDGDGNMDMVAHFVVPTRTQLGLLTGQVNTTAIVTGSLTNGAQFAGTDSVLIVSN